MRYAVALMSMGCCMELSARIVIIEAKDKAEAFEIATRVSKRLFPQRRVDVIACRTDEEPVSE